MDGVEGNSAFGDNLFPGSKALQSYVDDAWVYLEGQDPTWRECVSYQDSEEY